MARKPTKSTKTKSKKTDKANVEALQQQIPQSETLNEQQETNEPLGEIHIETEDFQDTKQSDNDAAETAQAQEPDSKQCGNKDTKQEIIEDMYKVNTEDTSAMMNYLGISLVPNFGEKDIWVRAVAKVQKRNGSMSWCVLKRQTHDKHNVEKIFGQCSPIHQIGRILPVEVIPENVLSGIVGRGRRYMEMTVNESARTEVDMSTLTDEEVKNKVIDVLIKEYFENYGKGNK